MAMHADQILKDRTERNRFLKEHYASPLPEEERDSFKGLDYFPVEAEWVVGGEYSIEDAHSVQVPSSAGMENPYEKIGVVVVTVGQATYRLSVLDDGDGDSFIPFRDATNGVETYDGGRYVGLTRGSGSAVSLDFNAARNPFCVYDEEFICPLPPAENWIATRIPAGEKMYVG